MIVAVLILVKSRPQPTKRKPRLLLAKKRLFSVSVLCRRTFRQEMKATMPVQHRKVTMVSIFMNGLQRVSPHELGRDDLRYLFPAHHRLTCSFTHEGEVGGDGSD